MVDDLSMKLFLGFILMVGLVLTIWSFVIAGDVTDCNVKAQNAVRGLLTVGVCLFSVSATISAAMYFCDCTTIKGKSITTDNNFLGFVVFILALSATTVGLVSTIHKECEAARKNTGSLIWLSSLSTFGCCVYLAYRVWKVWQAKKASAAGSPGGTAESGSQTVSPGTADSGSSFGG